MYIIPSNNKVGTVAHQSGMFPFSPALPPQTTTYDHTYWKTRDPVRSPLVKSVRVRSVVGSVTTSESLMLYVFDFFGAGGGVFVAEEG